MISVKKYSFLKIYIFLFFRKIIRYFKFESLETVDVRSPSDTVKLYTQQIKPSLSFHDANSDLGQWQKESRKILTNLLGIDNKLVNVDSVDDLGSVKIISKDIVFNKRDYLLHIDSDLFRVSVVSSLNSFENDKKELMICLQGHNEGAYISWGECNSRYDYSKMIKNLDFAIQAVMNGYNAVCFDQIGFGNRKERVLQHRWSHTCLDAGFQRLLLGKTLLGDRVSDVRSVVSWLKSDLMYPNSKINIIGHSAGGDTAIYSAALDERIHGVIASGCIGRFSDTLLKRKTCIDTIIPGILKYFEYEDIVSMVAPRKLFVVSGDVDPIYPFKLVEKCIKNVVSLYDVNSASENIKVVKGDGGHEFYPKEVWPYF